MPTYELYCPKCSLESEVYMTISDYTSNPPVCTSCNIKLERLFNTAPGITIPYNMQAVPKREKGFSVPINIWEETPDGARCTRVGKKKDIYNE